MSKTLSQNIAPLADRSGDQKNEYADDELSLDELAEVSRSMLMDENLEVSKVRPFFWGLVEAYVERFQVFPFDAFKMLYRYLELHEYPEEEMRKLVKRLEKLYKKQHGRPLRESGRQSATVGVDHKALDDEITELRETLKYAAIVGERLDDDK